jgi:hypothetical protein
MSVIADKSLNGKLAPVETKLTPEQVVPVLILDMCIYQMDGCANQLDFVRQPTFAAILRSIKKDLDEAKQAYLDACNRKIILAKAVPK